MDHLDHFEPRDSLDHLLQALVRHVRHSCVHRLLCLRFVFCVLCVVCCVLCVVCVALCFGFHVLGSGFWVLGF